MRQPTDFDIGIIHEIFGAWLTTLIEEGGGDQNMTLDQITQAIEANKPKLMKKLAEMLGPEVVEGIEIGWRPERAN